VPAHEPVRPRALRIAALVLAAGRSSRMGSTNKLLADIDGAKLIARVVDAALGAGMHEVVVITGHDQSAVRAALAARPVRYAHNPRFADGLASSLCAGLSALRAGTDGVVVCLGDMPRVSSMHIAALADAFTAGAGADVCVPFHRGQRGNPVLWPARCFAALAGLAGDIGGRALLEREAHLCRVAIEDDGVLVDVDTPEALAAATSDRPRAAEAKSTR
jgi:molybdenum cofactor cytidylyltransferase